MNKKNYYEILGVGESATADEIKSAYRKLARKYHPDVCKEGDAEEKIKNINEAYSILSNDSKRRQYDQTRKYGFSGSKYHSSSSGPEDLSDWFNDFFRAHYTATDSRGKTHSSSINPDIHGNITLTFLEAALGCEKEIEFKKREECQGCKGIGYKGVISHCKTCAGRGVVAQDSHIGLRITMTCQTCKGKGSAPSDPCSACNTNGFTSKIDKTKVKIPAGVNTGTRMRFSGKGNYINGRPGNLIIEFIVNNNHPKFNRTGLDIHSSESVNLTDLLLAKNLKVETIHGKVDVSIPKGAQPNTKLRLGGLGIDGGDHYVELNLTLPKELTENQKNLIEKLGI